MVRIQDFHSWHTSSILVESTIKKSPVTTGMIINLNGFKIMAKNVKELSQVKARQTKLGKKSNDELIQIILKKDKIERNLNNQIKSLKGEVNALSIRANNLNKDIEGTYQTVETLKDKVKTLQETNDNLKIEATDNMNLYKEEGVKVTQMKALASLWKGLAIIASIAFGISIICHLL